MIIDIWASLAWDLEQARAREDAAAESLIRDRLARERKALDDRAYYAGIRPGRYKPDTIQRCRADIAEIDAILAT